ncbi:hypothetical protein GWP57_11935 [Gammaproteobacteria bacterium]|jgi:hypothetical protein|nr:hypothetical protein [Gammaproteobacteria bacterium]
MRAVRTILLLAIASLSCAQVFAQEQASSAQESVVTYPAEFFARYQPNTAFEMVSQVPGFQLDDGGDERGFGGSVGNVLINDRYPSAKQNKPSQILQRIPAAQVERIELIRGQVREIDLLGRPVVVNVILAQDTPAAIRWELALRKNLSLTPLAPIGSISISDRWRGMNYNFGIDGRRASFADPGTRELFDGDGTLTEIRYEDHEGTGFNANSQFTATGEVGATLLRLNAAVGAEIRNEELITLNDPEPPGSAPTNERLVRKRDNIKFEIGADAERNLSEDLVGKAILLYFQLDQGPSTNQRRYDTDGEETLYRKAETDAKATESIARLEFSWTKFENHVLQFNIEGAKNVLDSSLVQVVDTGDGPEIVPVPGANTRVEEVRGDVLVNDTWSFGDFKFEYGLGAETSTISQTGDAEQERSFSFVKPRAALTYAASPGRQTRLRLAREVSQLDFNDFVSATVFEDDDVALGNPNLQPESTWIAELSEEWRFGELGVVKVTAFHDWISDVEDLLPLTPEFEVPGNIGDGRRWGVELESTLPLQVIGLTGAKLDVKLRWQDSTVTDPVTGRSRVLTAEGGSSQDIVFENENRYSVILDFRQDLEAAKVAWGWHYATRAERPLFKVNELEIYDEGTQLNAFIETTRWWGLKIRFTANNILDVVDTRDRTIYTGERDLSPVEYRELRTLTNGTRLILSFSGAF